MIFTLQLENFYFLFLMMSWSPGDDNQSIITNKESYSTANEGK